MSILNSINTAVSGLNAESSAFTGLSNNISNSGTTGYKATTAAFVDYVTNQYDGEGAEHSDSVAERTDQNTQNQGDIETSTNSLALAISGNGFFNVVSSTADTANSSNDTQYYTRDGDFSQDKNGYFKNTSGYYLEGYTVGSDGTASTTLSALQVNAAMAGASPYTETTTLTLSGALSSSAGTATTTQTVYDSNSDASTATLTWTKDSSDSSGLTWTVSGGDDSSTLATVKFSSDGSLASITSSGETQSTSGDEGSFTFDQDGQSITVDLGDIGSSTGLSLSTTAGSSTASMTSDSVQGTYDGVSFSSDGSVDATYSNGTTKKIAEIPLASFGDADGLALKDGQAYTATSTSGAATENTVDTNGAGTLSTSSIEDSTTDLTSDLTKLIVYQEAYTADTKIVTTADELLQTTVQMIQ